MRDYQLAMGDRKLVLRIPIEEWGLGMGSGDWDLGVGLKISD